MSPWTSCEAATTSGEGPRPPLLRPLLTHALINKMVIYAGYMYCHRLTLFKHDNIVCHLKTPKIKNFISIENHWKLVIPSTNEFIFFCNCYYAIYLLYLRLNTYIQGLFTYGIHSSNSSSKLWLTQYRKGMLSPWRPGIILYTWSLVPEGWPTGCAMNASSSWWPGHSQEAEEGQEGPQWNLTKGKFLLQIPSTMENTWHNTSEGFILFLLLGSKLMEKFVLTSIIFKFSCKL